MNDKNLYNILGVDKNASDKEIKVAYYKLSKIHHPDKNNSKESEEIFKDISLAYSLLSNRALKEDYDKKSKFGKCYDEYFELFDISVDFTYEDSKNNLEKFKKNEINNIQVEIDDSFNGSIEYQRWVKCKVCDGNGKDMTGKIVIRDIDGNITKVFDSECGCDFCDGRGKDDNDNPCYFCVGQGKVGLNPCKSCGGEGRIMGKQKLSGIKLVGNETKLDTMGHFSKNGTGYLLLVKKSK